MYEGTKNYRKGEFADLIRMDADANYRVKVRVDDDETKWLTISDEELEDVRGILTGDAVNTALHILDRAGYAVRTVGAEDVHEVLNNYMHDNTEGVIDTVTYRDEITRHVMEGDDWEGVLDTDDVMSYLWAVVEGTNSDHPEWFPLIKPVNPVSEMPTPELVEEYVQLRFKGVNASHDEMEQYIRFGAELRRRGVIE